MNFWGQTTAEVLDVGTKKLSGAEHICCFPRITARDLLKVEHFNYTDELCEMNHSDKYKI